MDATKDSLWDDFGTGERVEVFGLSKAAAYNGRVGVVQRYDGESLSLSARLLALLAAPLTVHGEQESDSQWS